MEVKTLKFVDVVEAFYNPRKLLKKSDKAYQDIKKSLETYGSVEPLVVNDVNMRLISGHQRLQIMRDMGLTEGEFSIIHIEDPTEEKALNIALNKIKGKFDNAKLFDVLREIKDDVDITDLGFEMSEVEGILGDPDVDDALDGNDIDLEEKIQAHAPAQVMFKLGKSLSYALSTADFKAIERSCIEQGYFTDLEISQEIKRRLMYDKAD